MPVTEIDIPGVEVGCIYEAVEADANKAVKAAAQALTKGEPVLLTRPDTRFFDCGRDDGIPADKLVYSVLGAKPATNGTKASLTLKNPRGPQGTWPVDPASSKHANDTAPHFEVDTRGLGSSSLSFGKHEDRSIYCPD
jgi:hypothetical protein